MPSKAYIRYKSLGLCRRCGSTPLPGKTRCEKCHKDHIENSMKWRNIRIKQGLCRTCGIKPRVNGKSTCNECLEDNKRRQKQAYEELRERVLIAYGGYCYCCGTENKKYLQLDHIYNDGNKHRKEIFKDGRKGGMYQWAEKHGYPKTLQPLCANCHQAKTNHGGCTEEDHPLLKH